MDIAFAKQKEEYMSAIKNFVSEIFINDNKEDKKWHVIDDYFITALIVLNIVAMMFESIDTHYEQYKTYYHIFDLFSIGVFSVEYLIRIWIADELYPEYGKVKARFKYVFSFFGVIDLLAILPFYMPMFINLDLRFMRVLRLMRIFRVFKLVRFIGSLQLLIRVVKERKDELLITVFGAGLMMIISASLMYEIEHELQPDKFSSIFSSIWWAVATLTTIGYGDVYPVSGLGQFLAAITALFGIGLVAIPTGIISVGFLDQIQAKKEEAKENSKDTKYKYCPHCGEKLPD